MHAHKACQHCESGVKPYPTRDITSPYSKDTLGRNGLSNGFKSFLVSVYFDWNFPWIEVVFVEGLLFCKKFFSLSYQCSCGVSWLVLISLQSAVHWLTSRFLSKVGVFRYTPRQCTALFRKGVLLIQLALIGSVCFASRLYQDGGSETINSYLSKQLCSFACLPMPKCFCWSQKEYWCIEYEDSCIF